MAEYKNILTRLSKILIEIQLDYVIVGGMAAIIRGKPRTTMDVDLILENDAKKIQQFLKLLSKNDFDVLNDQVKWAFESGVNASIFDNLSSMRLDVKIANKTIDREALLDSSQEIFFDTPLKIASVNFILFGKIWFLGDISDIMDTELLEYNDIKDFIDVYLLNKEKVNMPWLESKCTEINLNSTLSRLLNYISQEFE